MEQARQVLGERAPRLDAIEKVTGRARYASDIVLPGMLYGVIVRSDRPFARLRRVDTSAAESVPGVEAVATATDAPGRFGEVVKDQPVFAQDVVRFVGEPIAAIATD